MLWESFEKKVKKAMTQVFGEECANSYSIELVVHAFAGVDLGNDEGNGYTITLNYAPIFIATVSKAELETAQKTILRMINVFYSSRNKTKTVKEKN